MEQPNLFSIATSELSQDAFLTWLISCADSKNENLTLKNAGRGFVNFLINQQINYSKEIVHVSAGRQWNNIDVWAKINDEILLVIEDKKYTAEHSEQLTRYKDFAEEWCRDNGFMPVFLFIKTVTQSKSANSRVENKGFSVIERIDLLNFFKKLETDNHIISEFFNFLALSQAKEDSFEILPYTQWTYDSWIGFYGFLDSQLDITDWKYVPIGDFIGAWWHFSSWKEYNVYLQIEQGSLCFKIGDVLENHSQIRNEWYEILIAKAKDEKLIEIKKPSRFGTGNCMTVAVVEINDWLGAEDRPIDKTTVIKKLQNYQEFLAKCIK